MKLRLTPAEAGITQIFECPKCATLHFRPEAAEDCCKPITTTVEQEDDLVTQE